MIARSQSDFSVIKINMSFDYPCLYSSDSAFNFCFSCIFCDLERLFTLLSNFCLTGGWKRYYDIWNVKYLSKIKWDDVTDEIGMLLFFDLLGTDAFFNLHSLLN